MTTNSNCGSTSLVAAIDNLIWFVQERCLEGRLSPIQYDEFNQLDGLVEALRRSIGIEYPQMDDIDPARPRFLPLQPFGYSRLMLFSGAEIDGRNNLNWLLRLRSLRAVAESLSVGRIVDEKLAADSEKKCSDIQDATLSKAPKKKRSTVPGEAEAKWISLLAAHHDCSSGYCQNTTPLQSNESARQSKISTGSTSRYFKKFFGSFKKYERLCSDSRELAREIDNLTGDAHPRKHRHYGDNVSELC